MLAVPSVSSQFGRTQPGLDPAINGFPWTFNGDALGRRLATWLIAKIRKVRFAPADRVLWKTLLWRRLAAYLEFRLRFVASEDALNWFPFVAGVDRFLGAGMGRHTLVRSPNETAPRKVGLAQKFSQAFTSIDYNQSNS